jgi:hypothetical protein
MLYLQCFYSTAQTLTSDISISTKMDMYHYKIDMTIYPSRFTTEKYFELKNIVNRSIVAQFRISAHRLRIETGRYEHIQNSQGNLVMLR